MEIHIDDQKSLDQLKDEFSARYPFLKIEFFTNAPIEGGSSPKSDMITDNSSLGEIRKKHNEGDISILGEMKVGELEKEFENRYGIHIQVFRKSGELWLETSATDDWSLNEQNLTGEEMS